MEHLDGGIGCKSNFDMVYEIATVQISSRSRLGYYTLGAYVVTSTYCGVRGSRCLSIFAYVVNR